jgi:hypothetical protein
MFASTCWKAGYISFISSLTGNWSRCAARWAVDYLVPWHFPVASKEVERGRPPRYDRAGLTSGCLGSPSGAYNCTCGATSIASPSSVRSTRVWFEFRTLGRGSDVADSVGRDLGTTRSWFTEHEACSVRPAPFESIPKMPFQRLQRTVEDMSLEGEGQRGLGFVQTKAGAWYHIRCSNQRSL